MTCIGLQELLRAGRWACQQTAQLNIRFNETNDFTCAVFFATGLVVHQAWPGRGLRNGRMA